MVELVCRNWRNARLMNFCLNLTLYKLCISWGCSLLFPTAIANGGQSIRTNFALTKSNTGIKFQQRLIVKHGFNWCEIHNSHLWSFRWSEKYSDSISRIWFIHEESRNVTNSKLDWVVVFTARYARRNGKTVHLGSRLQNLSKVVADLLVNHEGWYTREWKQVNPLTGSRCGIVQSGKKGQEPAVLH